MCQSNQNIQIAVEINSSIAVAHIKANKTYQISMCQSNPNIQITVEINSSTVVVPIKDIKTSSTICIKSI